MKKHLLVALFLVSTAFSSLPASALATVSLDVDTTVDDPALTACTTSANDCSLRGAIIAANGSPGKKVIINIPAGNFDLTVPGAGENNAATGDLDLRNTITLQGAGQNQTYISAWQITDRVLHVLRDSKNRRVRVRVFDLTVENGNASGGGNIRVQGGNTAIIRRSQISDGIADNGGGIYSIGSTVELSDSLVVGNNSMLEGGGLFFSGGQLTMVDTEVLDNDAVIRGGGLHNDGGIVVATNSIFNTNTASDFQDGSGGGISNDSNGTITLTGVTVDQNIALGDGTSVYPNLVLCPSNPGGGGIYNEGVLIINGGSLIDRNVADTNYGCGGGIYSKGGQVEVYDSAISENRAGAGGGIYTTGTAVLLSTAEVRGNLANLGGGGIHHSVGPLDILSNSIIEDNRVNDTLGTVANGGGIHNGYQGVLTLTDAIVRNNEIIADAARGGGIFTANGLTMSNTLVRGNRITANLNNAEGAGIGTFNNQGSITITNDSRIIFNHAEAASSAMGGVYVSTTYPVTISDSRVSHNEALGGAVGGDATGGFHLDLLGSTLTITNAVINDNSSQIAGPGSTAGGVRIITHIEPSSSSIVQASIADTEIGNNSAGAATVSAGGGIQLDARGIPADSLTVTRCNIHDNVADFGGGIALLGDFGDITLYVNDSRIDSNAALVSGGGIWINNSTLGEKKAVLNGSTISNNTGVSGAGIYVGAEDSPYLSPVISRLAVNNSTISGNTATDKGGGLYVFEDNGNDITAEVGLNNVSFVNNTGQGTQNALHVKRGTVTIQNSLVSDTPVAVNPSHCSITNGGVITSGGYNLESATSCGFIQPGDIQNLTSTVDVLLLNGGLTRTHALPAGHEAIDAGNPSGCTADLDGDGMAESTLAIDQRGSPRPVDGDGDAVGVCDIGAFEYP